MAILKVGRGVVTGRCGVGFTFLAKLCPEMARKKKHIQLLWENLLNEGYFEVDLRWAWIDYNFLALSDVLEFTGLPRGRFESFQRRQLFFSMEERVPVGSGHHLLYTPRTALKLLAVDGLVGAGAWPECLQETFGKSRDFDQVLNGYQFGEYTAAKGPERIAMNTRMIRTLYDTGATHPYKDEVELNLARLSGEWPKREWAFLTFDVAVFIAEAMPKLIRFLESKSITVTDR